MLYHFATLIDRVLRRQAGSPIVNGDVGRGLLELPLVPLPLSRVRRLRRAPGAARGTAGRVRRVRSAAGPRNVGPGHGTSFRAADGFFFHMGVGRLWSVRSRG
jgi:hypothetical protein